MRDLIQRINAWLNSCPPFARYAVAFGGMLACVALSGVLSVLIRMALRGWH